MNDTGLDDTNIDNQIKDNNNDKEEKEDNNNISPTVCYTDLSYKSSGRYLLS